mmetsp:Transcript_31931/g.102493  ORF Transcript_31931/g.102493 Transcript_31931/m.102493 type:complete len:297 (+) Transcript_31931:201-1091(+)
MMASMRYSHKYNSGVVLPRIGAATPACSPAHPKAAALPRPRQREAAPGWRRPLGWSRGAGRLVVVVRVGVQVDVVDEVEGRAAVVEAGRAVVLCLLERALAWLGAWAGELVGPAAVAVEGRRRRRRRRDVALEEALADLLVDGADQAGRLRAKRVVPVRGPVAHVVDHLLVGDDVGAVEGDRVALDPVRPARPHRLHPYLARAPLDRVVEVVQVDEREVEEASHRHLHLAAAHPVGEAEEVLLEVILQVLRAEDARHGDGETVGQDLVPLRAGDPAGRHLNVADVHRRRRLVVHDE